MTCGQTAKLFYQSLAYEMSFIRLAAILSLTPICEKPIFIRQSA